MTERTIIVNFLWGIGIKPNEKEGGYYFSLLALFSQTLIVFVIAVKLQLILGLYAYTLLGVYFIFLESSFLCGFLRWDDEE